LGNPDVGAKLKKFNLAPTSGCRISVELLRVLLAESFDSGIVVIGPLKSLNRVDTCKSSKNQKCALREIFLMGNHGEIATKKATRQSAHGKMLLFDLVG